MKGLKRLLITFLLCTLILGAFTACHSHEPEWKIDEDSHWKECDCGEISEEGEHTFELDICTVCGAERKTEDGKLTDISLLNEYGDWTQWLYFDEEGNFVYESSAEYTYDKDGNKLSDVLYDDGVLASSGEYAYDSQGFTYKKYMTEAYEDGTKCVYEYNEKGDSIGYILYDEEGSQIESYRSEYLTDENGDLTGEKVYINDVLYKEMKYSPGKDGDEEYLYIKEETIYSDDGSKNTDIYDEEGYVIQQISYDAEGNKLHTYDVEYFFDDDGNHVATEKREKGVLKEEKIHEYDEEGYLLSSKTYVGDKLTEEAVYTVGENSSGLSKIITYNDDGTTTVEEYDEYGNVIE